MSGGAAGVLRPAGTQQRNRYGQISYPYHVPKNPNSLAQRLVRGNWRAVSQRWRTLSEDQRQGWCREARHQKSRRRLGQSFPLSPKPPVAPFRPLPPSFSSPKVTLRPLAGVSLW